MSISGITEQVIQSLRAKIITCHYPPGQRLGEIEIAEDFGVSRTPVREAIKVLSEQNLMVNLPRKGTYVANISADNLEELFAARKMVESSALELIANNHENREQILDSIEKTLADAEQLVDSSSIDELYKKHADITHLFQDFHIALVSSAGNDWLERFYNVMTPSIARYIYIYLYTSGVAEQSIQHHREVLNMLREGKKDQAKKALMHHISFSCDIIKKNIFTDPQYIDKPGSRLAPSI